MGTGSGTNFATTPSLGLRQPTPGVCGALGVEPPGTSWLELINGSFATLDGHTHAPGFGSLVPTAGLNINADLPFGGFNATGLRSARFSAQGSPLALPTDLGCLYFSGVDAYVNDLNGNQIRLTSGGALAGTPGSISGLVSPAAASYTPASKLFALTSSSGFAANLSCGPVSIADAQNSGGKACTLQVPTGLASNYNLTLPTALPGSNGLLGISTTGQLSTFGVTSGSNLTLAGNLAITGALSGVTTLGASGLATTGGIQSTGSGTSAGGQFANGTAATGGTRRKAIIVSNGDVDMSGVVVPLAGTTMTKSQVTPKNLVQYWADLTLNAASNPTVNDGYGNMAFTQSGNVITVTFPTAMASANYLVKATMNTQASAGGAAFISCGAKSTTGFTITLLSSGFGNPSQALISGFNIDVLVVGAM